MNSIAFNNWLNRYQKYCRKEGDGFLLSFGLLDEKSNECFEVRGQNQLRCIRDAINKQLEMASDLTEISGFWSYDEGMQSRMFYLSPEYIVTSSDIEDCVAILNKEKLEILLYGGCCSLRDVRIV